MNAILPADSGGTLVGRVWDPTVHGPCVVAIRDGRAVDFTSRAIPTMRDLLESPDPVVMAAEADGRDLGVVAEIAAATIDGRSDVPTLLAPVDLQAIKACGVTFVVSLLERLIEEAAGGSPVKAAEVRKRFSDVIGGELTALVPGSAEAQRLKAELQARGLWSPYLEVGIGPDPEVFTKAQPLSAVGFGMAVGVHPDSQWSNPEPEVVLVVNSRGVIVGATLGNDVNLRDIEGRSALLLGKAKDNNASAALGPFIRLFDDSFDLNDVRSMEVGVKIEGPDGFHLEDSGSMTAISRDPTELVRAVDGAHHNYPDGFCLYMGSLFAPISDRDEPGMGFTHKTGDKVTISSRCLGTLVNTVLPCPDCPPWTTGTAALMRNLAGRGLL